MIARLAVRPWLAAAASAALTAAVASMLHPSSAYPAVLAAAACHALGWSALAAGRWPSPRAFFSGLACGVAAGIALTRLPEAFLSSDRLAGGASVGLAFVVLPGCAAVATLAALAVQALVAGAGDDTQRL